MLILSSILNLVLRQYIFITQTDCAIPRTARRVHLQGKPHKNEKKIFKFLRTLKLCLKIKII